MRVVLFSLLPVMACTQISVCPPGSHESGPVCVLDDAGVDANVDASAPVADAQILDGSPIDSGGTDACSSTRYYRDLDGDGHGDTTSYIDECLPPEGYVTVSDDCDDECRDCHPGLVEICDLDGRDEDCSGAATEACVCTPSEGPCQWGCEDGMCNDAVAISRGIQHMCVVRRNGSVACGGYNYETGAGGGSLGRPTSTYFDLTLGVVPGLRARDIELGGHASCALDQERNLWCWGANQSGQLGLGTTQPGIVLTPTRSVRDVTSFSLGTIHSCASLVNGEVQCWGAGDLGRLGNGLFLSSTSPVRAQSLTDVAKVAVGLTFSCALRRNGDVWCWGEEPAMDLASGVPVRMTALSNMSAIAAGHHHLCAINADLSLVCLGRNANGQLGDGTTVDRDVPTVPVGVTRALYVAAGDEHTCLVELDRTVSCFGANTHGQLGNNAMSERATAPVTVAGIENAATLALGTSSSCVILRNSRLMCWGNGTLGQLGTGGFTNQLTPAPVLTPSP